MGLIAKRLLDVLVAATGLLALGPAMGLVALLIKRSSPGPVIFRQYRVGRGGGDFVLYKFRTMTTGDGSEGRGFQPGETRRITPVGAVLRRLKIDEWPQLVNVLKGDMALVGPRPEVRRWVEVYPERWARVLTVRPGMTDPASIAYRDEEHLLAASADPERTYREVILPHKLDLYEQYVARHSLGGDLRLILATAWAVLGPRPSREHI